MTIWSCWPLFSISALARIIIRPRPVSNASFTPCRPKISPPVGKSGALTYSISSATVGSRICPRGRWMRQAIRSGCVEAYWLPYPPRYPTLRSPERFGILAGEHSRFRQRVVEVWNEIHGILVQIAQHLSSPMRASFASVYRMAAGESPSIEPKLPCPNTRG